MPIWTPWEKIIPKQELKMINHTEFVTRQSTSGEFSFEWHILQFLLQMRLSLT